MKPSEESPKKSQRKNQILVDRLYQMANNYRQAFSEVQLEAYLTTLQRLPERAIDMAFTKAMMDSPSYMPAAPAILAAYESFRSKLDASVAEDQRLLEGGEPDPSQWRMKEIIPYEKREACKTCGSREYNGFVRDEASGKMARCPECGLAALIRRGKVERI